MIRKMKREEFNQIYKMMEISFPLDEYRTYDEQKYLLNDSKYPIYIFPDNKTDQIKAFIAAW